MESGSNADLLERIRSGDQSAWNEVVAKYSGRLWAVARGEGLDHHTATDVIQTAWLNLLDSADKIRQPDALGAWLASVTRHEAIRVSKRARRAEVVDDVERRGGVLVADGEPDDHLIAGENAGIIRRAMAHLDERCRELLHLMFSSDEFSYGEIADLLDCPVGSLGPTRARCLDRLRRLAIDEGLTYPGES